LTLTSEKEEHSLIFGHFFFVDIVGLSNPDLSTRIQMKKLKELNKLISESPSYRSTPKENMLILPTGDGMCIGFLQGPDLPLKVALELQEGLDLYNKGKLAIDTVQIRIGLNSGSGFIFEDLRGDKNIWGPGVIMARRIMDLGDDGHILLGQSLAENLIEISDEYRKKIKPVHDYTVKHGVPMLIYSAYGKDFGNPTPPTKNQYQQSRMQSETKRLQNTTMYPEIRVDLTLEDADSMLVAYKRKYTIENISDEPIKYILHGVATDVPKNTINDLDLRIIDDKNKEVKISSINLDKPYTKEFSIIFEEPILKAQKGRHYTMEYKTEEPERFFENSFMVNTNSFIISFSSKRDAPIKEPCLYEVNTENDEKTPIDSKPVITNLDNQIVKVCWNLDDIVKGHVIRLEW